MKCASALSGEMFTSNFVDFIFFFLFQADSTLWNGHGTNFDELSNYSGGNESDWLRQFARVSICLRRCRQWKFTARNGCAAGGLHPIP